MKKESKKAQFNFSILFAVIAGTAILFLAIYGAMKLGGIQSYQSNTEVAKQISILTDPMQAGIAAEKSSPKIVFQKQTLINNVCYSENFGENQISVSMNLGKNSELGASTSVKNKYIFSSNENATVFYVFSKSFELPFKISDLIFLTSKKYCFIDAPANIEDELGKLSMENVEIKTNEAECSSDSVKVCFGKECDISIYETCEFGCEYKEGYVKKGNERFDYAGSLMYGAIFSDKEIYDCNVKRLLYRTSKIANIYSEKAGLITDCNNLQSDLNSFSDLTSTSDDLISINTMAKQIDKENTGVCKTW